MAAKLGDEEVRLAALGRLFERYRRPICLEMRYRRHCPADQAEELTAEFIAHCLRRDFLKNVSPEFGRFRTFVKQCIRNFLRDVHASECAIKRGGGEPPLSLEMTDDEGNRVIDPPGSAEAPASVTDREWALQLLQGSLSQLERECVAARRGPLFEALKPTLSGEPGEEVFATIATRLGMPEGAVKVAAHRMRRRLGEVIEEEVKQTVGSEDDWREELRYLVSLLGGGSA